MTTPGYDPNRAAELRSRAVALLRGPVAQAYTDASAALGVLYDLASSPATAPDALALLHELQVHQVEVDLQDEELRRARADLEASLNRQVQLYDHAPAGFYTVDFHAVLRELNRTGATLLGLDREVLRGRSLETCLTPESVSTLRAMLARVTGGVATDYGELHLRALPGGVARRVHSSACLDPMGGGFLIGMIAAAGASATPPT
jgi:PAS domain S-box-containing protein